MGEPRDFPSRYFCDRPPAELLRTDVIGLLIKHTLAEEMLEVRAMAHDHDRSHCWQVRDAKVVLVCRECGDSSLILTGML